MSNCMLGLHLIIGVHRFQSLAVSIQYCMQKFLSPFCAEELDKYLFWRIIPKHHLFLYCIELQVVQAGSPNASTDVINGRLALLQGVLTGESGAGEKGRSGGSRGAGGMGGWKGRAGGGGG